MPYLGQDPAIPPLAPEPAPAPSIEPDIVETQNFNTGATMVHPLIKSCHEEEQLREFA